jgi:hypothetical protein
VEAGTAIRVSDKARRSIKLSQLEFDAVIAAVELEPRVMLAVEDQAAADERLALLAVLRSEWGK